MLFGFDKLCINDVWVAIATENFIIKNILNTVKFEHFLVNIFLASGNLRLSIIFRNVNL